MLKYLLAAFSSAMAIIPVIAEIYNASSCPVTARLSTNEDSGKYVSSRLLLNSEDV